jgi:chorismate mutase/prephenate dehydratase
MKGEDGIMTELDELRQKLDSIDSRIIDAFEDRMKTVRKIAEYKLKNGLRVLDRSRELEVLEDRAARLRNKELCQEM